MGINMSRAKGLPMDRRCRPFLQQQQPRTTATTTTTASFFPPPPQPPQKPPQQATTVSLSANRIMAFHSSAKWRAYLQSTKNKLIVVYFTATWCGPCKMIEPTFSELASKFGDVDFVKIDVDELMEVSSEYGVQVLPAFLMMKNGEVVDRLHGVNNELLRNKIQFNSTEASI